MEEHYAAQREMMGALVAVFQGMASSVNPNSSANNADGSVLAIPVVEPTFVEELNDKVSGLEEQLMAVLKGQNMLLELLKQQQNK